MASWTSFTKQQPSLLHNRNLCDWWCSESLKLKTTFHLCSRNGGQVTQELSCYGLLFHFTAYTNLWSHYSCVDRSGSNKHIELKRCASWSSWKRFCQFLIFLFYFYFFKNLFSTISTKFSKYYAIKMQIPEQSAGKMNFWVINAAK